MAEGYVFNGNIPVRMRDDNTYRWNGTAWVLCGTLHALVGGGYQDILAHPPPGPAPDTVVLFTAHNTRVLHESQGRFLGINLRDILAGAGHDPQALAASGRVVSVCFARNPDSAQPGYNGHGMLLCGYAHHPGGVSTYTTPLYISAHNVYNPYSFDVSGGALLAPVFDQAWIASSPSTAQTVGIWCEGGHLIIR